MKEDSDFFYQDEEENKATYEWLEKHRRNYDAALNYIRDVQRELFFSYELLFVVMFFGLGINIFSSQLFSILEIIYPVGERYKIFILSSFFLLLSFLCFHILKLRYKHQESVLFFNFTLEDSKSYIADFKYNKIKEYIDNRNLTNFDVFCERFVRNFSGWFLFIFGEKVNNNPISTNISYEDEEYRPKYPTYSVVYDISETATTGVKINFQIYIQPYVISEIDNIKKLDLTSARGFNIQFVYTILNPEHRHSDDVLFWIFHRTSQNIPKFTSMALSQIFSVLIKDYNLRRK
ncbi:hypothetical protein KAU18_07130 [Candidatus Bathyarchaeota archaeon]|nr:hypothetical protein [Candidatus Bathyarchaeota archaeon]